MTIIADDTLVAKKIFIELDLMEKPWRVSMSQRKQYPRYETTMYSTGLEWKQTAVLGK